MPINSDFATLTSDKPSKNSSGISSFSATMAASRSGIASSEAQSSNNSNKNIENSLIKHQGQKWQQFFDFDRMLKQIRVAEKQHFRSKGESTSSNNGKSGSSNSSTTTSKSGSSSSKGGGRSLRQVQRLSGLDMHYYGIVPKKTSADVIVCSICRGIYTMVGFNNHMLMQHPTAWGAASAKLSHVSTSNEMYTLISNDNSQDCVRDGSGATAPSEIFGSPSDLSGVMSTSSNASSSSSSVSTTSSTYTAMPRHKSSKSSGTTAGSSSSGGSSSTSGSRSRSKQSRHNNSSNNHAASVGVHTPSTTSAEKTLTTSKNSKKSASSSSSNTNNNKNENINNPPSLVASASASSSAIANSGKHGKDTMADTTATNSIALFSSSSNSSCSLPPTPKLSTTIAEVKSPTFVAQESADSSVSSSSGEYERASCSGKAISVKSSHTLNATTAKAHTSTASCSIPVSKEATKATATKEITRYNSTQLRELDQAVSSITAAEEGTARTDKKMGGCIKNVIDVTTSLTPTNNNLFQMPTTTTVTEAVNNEKLQQTITRVVPNNINVVQAALPPNYEAPQELGLVCEDALPHNTSDDNSILTFDDVFDSKFINEILSTADTEIHFDENVLDTAPVAQHQQQQLQQESHQVYQHQQQQLPTAKRMRFDQTILASGPQQQQQEQGVEITGEFVAYQQQQQQQYVPYNVANLEHLKLFNDAGPLVEQQQQLSTHLQHTTDQQQQQQLTAIDAMQLQQLLYQQQTLNTHYDNGMVDDPADPTHLALQHQQYDQSGVVSAKQLIDMCATVDMKSNKLGEFSTISTAGAYVNPYDNMAAHFQLYNIPSLTDDNVDPEEQVSSGADSGMLLPNIVGGMPRAPQQYVGEDHLIYEITDNNQVAVISQQRQQQMLTEFLTHANYDQVATDMNAAATPMDTTTAVSALMQQNDNGNNMSIRYSTDETDDDLLEFDYSLLETVKAINSSSGSGVSTSSGAGGSKAIKSEFNNSGGNSNSSSKYFEDVYLNAYLYAGVPKPIAINCFGLIKLPFAAATTFRKHILNARKANNSPITLSGGGVNGIVCSNASAAARLSNNSKSMQNYFSNLTSSSNSLVGNEFSIGSITITNSSVTQSQLYASQQKQQNTGSNNGGGGGGVEITFNTNTNGCSSAMSPVSSSMQRSRTKSGNSAGSGAGGATLVRSKSQTGAPVAVVTPTSRLPPPPRPSTAGPVLAPSSKTIFVSNTAVNGNDRVKLIKRCMPLVNSSNNHNSRNDGSKRQKFSPRQIADFLGGISHNNSRSGGNHKSLSAQQCADVGTNGCNNNNHEVIANNNSGSHITTSTSSPDEQLKLDRVARFYERRRKLFDLARSSRQQQQQQQQQQRKQPPQLQQKLLKQQQQLFKMLTDYGQLNAAVGNCKGVNANANLNSGNNNSNSGSETLRISV